METTQQIAMILQGTIKENITSRRRTFFKGDVGTGRFFKNQTYHHAVMRPLNHVAAGGADISEILQLTTRVRAGDEQGWYREWTDLGDHNVARGKATNDRLSRGEAFLRAHTYYARAEFYLPPDDPKRPESFNRNRRMFYEGLDTLGIAYERISVPYGENR